ncbi:MAG TPA: hypothetical protein VI197_13015 [Polyangiaceae bacterium]
MRIRIGVLGLLGLGAVWSCGGTVTHGDAEASDSDASDSTNGTGGGDDDGFGDFGSGGSGGTSASAVGGSDSTGGDGPGSAATTRGGGSRNNSASGTTTTGGSTAGSSAASTGVGMSSGAGGQSATSTGVGTSVSTTGRTTIGSGGFGGDTTSSVSTFGSISVVTSTSTTSTSTTGTQNDPSDLEDFPYLDGCDPLYWSNDTQYCSLGFECPSEAGRTSCWNAGNGELTCECYTDYSWSTYRLTEAELQNACAYVASGCVAGADAERGSPKCTPTYLSQGTTYCSASAECRTRLAIDGADMAKTHSLYASCEQREDAWVCSCSIPSGSVSVTLDGSSGSADMCLDALDWCTGDVTREGPRECTPTSQYAETQSCYANLACTQAAVAGGTPATITEYYTLSCRRADAGQWTCDCPGKGSFDVESETGWDACTLGASECTPT